MSSSLSLSLSLLPTQPFLSPNPSRFKTRTHYPFSKPSLVVAKLGFFDSGHLPDPGVIEGTIKEVFGKAEGLFYTIADAAVSNADAVVTSTDAAKQNGDWLSGISGSMEAVLKVLKDGLSVLHVPYAYGFAIILLTVLVKAATFPLSKKQVESAMAMRALQPQTKAIQERYAGDQERIQLETAQLYKRAGINPLAGCLPTLATIPVWIGLYRALSNVANEGLLTEGFFWIPSLAGPTTVAARQNGSGISWLFPFVDGHPPLGWSDTAAYLVLPVLLILSQYISIQIMQSSQPNDPNMKSSQALTKVLPLMIGYFALSVPSGLSLYWLTNNILSTAQQVYLQKKGGAKNPLGQLNENVLKDEQSNPQKVIFEPQPNQTDTKSIQTGTKSTQIEEITSSTGLRPGERFKQLKEEEARRKRQREEAAAKAAVVTKDAYEKQDEVLATANGKGTSLINDEHEKDQSVILANNTPNGSSVNGNVHDTPSDKIAALTNVDGSPINKAELLSEEDLKKEAVEVHDRPSSSSGGDTY